MESTKERKVHSGKKELPQTVGGGKRRVVDGIQAEECRKRVSRAEMAGLGRLNHTFGRGKTGVALRTLRGGASRSKLPNEKSLLTKTKSPLNSKTPEKSHNRRKQV